MINLPLYFLSFEYDTQDELIKLLKDAKSLNKNKYGYNIPLLSESELNSIESYEKICKSISGKPSIELLKQKFPTMVFDGIDPVKYKQLDEQIRLDISSKIQDDSARMLSSLAVRVKNEGLNSDVIDDMLTITRSESNEKSEYKDLLPNLKEIYDNVVNEKGIKTGVKQIDDLTGGLQPGTFNCLAGFAGAGKTTAAVNIAYNALNDGKNVCYLTLEVPKIDMYYNFGSRHSFDKKFKKQISHSDLKKKELAKKDVEYFFTEVMPDFAKTSGKLYILDETEIESYTFSSFESKIRECDNLAIESTGHGIDLVVVDQAQLLKFSSNMSSAGLETSVINLYVSFFRQQAINFLRTKRPCTILMLSQINRDGFSRACKNGGKYTLTSLAEANELERASAMVISVFSDEGLKASKQVQVQLLKSRNGQTMIEPAIAFMDPVYYVFGSEVSNSGQMFSSATADIFGMSGGAMDLSGSEISDKSNMLDGLLDNIDITGGI